MNSAEAKLILARELARLRARPLQELVRLTRDAETLEIEAPSGACYQIEFQASWDPPARREVLRVSGAIDDGGLRAFSPVTDSFRVTAGGKFVD